MASRGFKPTPGASRVLRELRRQVLSGHLVPGTPLPSVRTVAAGTGLSAFPVHQAFKQIEAEGWATRRNGGKLWVTENAIEQARTHVLKEPGAVIHFLSALQHRVGMEPLKSAYASGFFEVFGNCSIRHVYVDIAGSLDPVRQLLAESERVGCETGFVLLSLPPRFQELLQSSGVPCVFLGQASPEYNLPCIYEDMSHIGYVAGRLLCRSERVFTVYTGDLYGSEVYLIDGVRRAARERGQSEPQWGDFYRCLSNDPAECERQLSGMLSNGDASVGLFALRPDVAMLGAKVATRLGLRIPQEVQLIGYTHQMMYTLIHPEVTSVGPRSLESISRRAAEMLADSMGRRPQVAPRESVESSLIERQSTLPE